MKKRLYFTFTDKEGVTWHGDCPRWAARTRATGRYKEGRMVVLSSSTPEPCDHIDH
ncbi:hypothetical protein GCM10010331_44580 [Streptomyces xanthochromogenes]|nr:hypothetical protein GCM10010331_44580 [Streptomyces xanthochromogenes]